MMTSRFIKINSILKQNLRFNYSLNDFKFITDYFCNDQDIINKERIRKYYQYELNLIESKEFYLKNRIKDLQENLRLLNEEKNDINYINVLLNHK